MRVCARVMPLLLALLSLGRLAGAAPKLVLNELMAGNQNTIVDPAGDYDDWIEICNYGDTAVNLGGFYLTDDLGNTTKWRIPTGAASATTVAAHGYLLIWADQEPGEGPLHANFKLSAEGEQIGLYDTGKKLVDSVTFGPQDVGKSYGRLPDGTGKWQVLGHPTPGKSNQTEPVTVVINEIMFHPFHKLNEPENAAQEYIELYNWGTKPVKLTGWSFSRGVDFAFPDVTLNAGAYLVVAADTGAFKTRYSGITNVIGDWTGRLSNSGETVELTDAAGVVIDSVHYCDEGDWAVRVLGPVDRNHRGWEWSEQTDGGGGSLELINPALDNECGQNWAASQIGGGTPGRANSVAADNVAPLIVDVEHIRVIPGPTDKVTVTARLIDERADGVTAKVHYRVDKSTYEGTDVYPRYQASDYTSVPMFDDGAHGDGKAGDGVFGGQIPALPDRTVVEFFLEATDKSGASRTWPAPSLMDDVPQQVTNLLYQVDQTFDAAASWVPGSQPIYFIIMTEMERGRLAYIGTHGSNQGPNTRMNATLISVDGVGTDVRHNLGVRIRGHGTRNQQPNQYRVDFPHDRPWKDVTSINLNTNYTYVEAAGYAVFQMAGLVASDAHPVQVRVNGQNLAPASTTRTSGSYDHVEVINSDWAARHFPDDPDGNAYKCMRSDNPSQAADLHYLGTKPDSYRISYFKQTNVSDEDWSDLIELTRVLSSDTPDSAYVEQVQRVVDVEQWLRFLAVNTLLDNSERSIGNGTGDEYYLYRGVQDKRFVLIPHDLEALFGVGDEMAPSVTHDIFRAAAVPAISRLMKHPQFVPRYYWHLKNLIDTTFSAKQFNPFLDDVLGEWVPAARIAEMKKFIADRNAYVLSVLPKSIKVTTAPPVEGGYPHTTLNTVSLAGQADVIETRRVTVNGLPAVWSPWEGTWFINSLGLLPGINRLVIQTFDAEDQEVDSSSIDIWYDTPSMVTKAGGTLGSDEVWTAAGGPYHVTGNITIPAGRTLTIEPGTTVFLDSGRGFTVYGRLVVQGTEYQRIRFTRTPGTTGQWAGFQLPDTKEDNIIAYADLEFGGSRSQWITTGNNSGSSVGPTARLTVDHATFSGSDTQYFSIWDPQIIIRNSVFADLGSHYVCMAERMPTDGWFIVEGNLFGHCHGDTDIFHLNSVSVKGGPVAQIINNVFTGGGDDIVDDNESDTHIEGNLFMHANVGNSARSASAAVTTGPGGGSASADNLESQHLIVVRNIFYHNDYGILSKTGAYSEIYNNVFIQNAGAILFDEPARSDSGPGRACYVESCIFWNNGPEVDGTSSDNGTGTFVNRQDTELVVNNSIVKGEFLALGAGNIDADPLLVDADRELYVDANSPRFSTGFPGCAEGGYLLKGMIPDVHLRPESPARGAGFNGVDMGPCVPATASIGNVPPSRTARTDATLTVGGTDVYGYKYRVEGPGFSGTWSDELARMMPVTVLTHHGATAIATVASHGFANGDVVEISGADRPAYNGQFVIFGVTPNAFCYTLSAAVDLLHSNHLDVWVRRPEPILLAGLTNGIYTVSVIKKNSMGVWQDESQPTTATWTVDTSYRHLVINEVLTFNESAVEHEGTFPDLVELYYDGATALSLAGMSLSDDPEQPAQFVFPDGSKIAPGEYLVLFADANTATSGIHLGFGLDGEGDGLYLYDPAGTLLDSVEFGTQLPDLSIGRLGDSGPWHLTIPTFGEANVAHPLGSPDAIKINEWLASGQVLFSADFIELYNPQASPVDLGEMCLTSDPVRQPAKYRIGPLSFIAGTGYATFWADNSPDPGHVSFRLSADGQMIGLSDRQLKGIDKVLFGPQTTDFSEGREPDGADAVAILPLPTPGVANPMVKKTTTTAFTLVEEAANKRVLVPTGPVSDDWRGGKPFDDSAWIPCTGAPGGVGYEHDHGYESLITLDTQAQMYGSGKNNSCYIRIPFTVNAAGLADVNKLTLKMRYDDGFIAYLNGREVARREFTGDPSWNSHADTAGESNVQSFDEFIDISPAPGDLKAGANILAIHGMNASLTSSDFLITAALDAVSVKVEGGQSAFEGDLKLLDGLRITELMYHSPQGGNYDYVELQNVLDEVLDVNGVRFGNGINFTFPALVLQPGERIVVAADLPVFRSTYGAGPKVVGQYSGSLNNGGEEIVLQLPAPFDAAILRFRYDNTWYPETDGGGQSLALLDPLAPPVTWNDPESWQAADPTPGQP